MLVIRNAELTHSVNTKIYKAETLAGNLCLQKHWWIQRGGFDKPAAEKVGPHIASGRIFAGLIQDPFNPSEILEAKLSHSENIAPISCSALLIRQQTTLYEVPVPLE